MLTFLLEAGVAHALAGAAAGEGPLRGVKMPEKLVWGSPGALEPGIDVAGVDVRLFVTAILELGYVTDAHSDSG
jgi:hypothetical protein